MRKFGVKFQGPHLIWRPDIWFESSQTLSFICVLLFPCSPVQFPLWTAVTCKAALWPHPHENYIYHHGSKKQDFLASLFIPFLHGLRVFQCHFCFPTLITYDTQTIVSVLHRIKTACPYGVVWIVRSKDHMKPGLDLSGDGCEKTEASGMLEMRRLWVHA